MSWKIPGVRDDTHERSTARISRSFYSNRECLCGCGEVVEGTYNREFVAGHESTLACEVVINQYDDLATFIALHAAGSTGNDQWHLTPWQPTTAIGQQARGRVFWQRDPHFHGLAELDTSYHGDDEAEYLYSNISAAGARLDTEFKDPFLEQRQEHDFRTAGPKWQTARRKLLTFYKRRPVPASSDKDELLAYTVARSKLEEAFELAPDAPEEFVVPGQAAFNVLQSGLPEQAEKMLRDATESYVLDVDSWVILAAEAFKAGRLDDALGFAEAAVAVAERALPDRFSGTLRSSWGHNNNYLLGRRVLVFVLWKLNRFGDAYRVAVDTVWLDPHDGQKIRWYLGDIKRRVPYGAVFAKGGSPI